MLLSIQLYTVRDLLAKDVKGTLKALKSMGLDYVEGANGYDLSSTEWKELLGEIGLTASGSHVSLETLVRNPKAVAEEAKLFGYANAIVPYATGENYAGGWKAFAKILDLLAAQLHAFGIGSGYHNHAHELEFEDGIPALDVIFQNTNPTYVKAQIDIGWINFGGGNPCDYIEKYSARLDSVHLKDSVRGEKHIDVVAGTGQVDWDAVIATCKKVGCKTGVLEMDNPPGDALASIEKSVEFYKSKGVGV